MTKFDGHHQLRKVINETKQMYGYIPILSILIHGHPSP